MSTTEKRLLVLGGTSGIGATIADTLVDAGIYRAVKVVGYEDFNAVYRTPMLEVVEEFDPTDIVHSVGINTLDWIPDIRQVDFINLMQTNVWSFVNLIQVLAQYGREQYNVVAISSDAAWRAMRTSLAYCASKAALEMAIRVASREYAAKGWRINGVAPGKVAGTKMTEYVDARVLELRGWSVEAAEAYELQSTPLGRKVNQVEVAEVVAGVLFGPKAQTGEIVAVNGGR
jgi:NAD(P)-dependent dehydrogenase (short-subunit alcohol dehydrogenase family)